MEFNRRNAASVCALLAGALLLSSCAGFVIHDEARAKLAADAKQNYADAKISEVADADRANLALLLGAEIKTVRETYRIRVDYAALGIANDSTPIGRTYKEATDRLKELGLDTVGGLKTLLEEDVDRRNAQHTISSFLKAFSKSRVTPPPCGKLPTSLPLPANLNAREGQRLTVLYPEYQKACAKLVGQAVTKGRLGIAHGEWDEARAALDEAKEKQAEVAKNLETAKNDYNLAMATVAEGAKKGQIVAVDIAGKAKAISQALKAARDLNVGLENEEQASALVDLLTAVAGGDVNPQDPDVARAATIAKQIPSLAGDIEQLEAKRTAPPVSGLLIALRHQTILAEGAKKRTALQEERVAILKAKYDAHYSEAERWLRFTNAMCSYAMLGAGLKHSGMKCETFTADAAGACTHAGSVVPACKLNVSWKAQFGSEKDPDSKRELYKATAAYFQALALQTTPLEESFREIDVRHREALLAKQNALEQWDNLVSVPLQQLDGYYQSGVKPAEIADLIVKALGLTAIAIGVSK